MLRQLPPEGGSREGAEDDDNLGEEGRFKIEAQPAYWKFGEERNYQLSGCISFLATSDLTIRLAYTYDHLANDNRVVLQLYYYTPVSWLSKLEEKLKSISLDIEAKTLRISYENQRTNLG
jgi:hypothetical protein